MKIHKYTKTTIFALAVFIANIIGLSHSVLADKNAEQPMQDTVIAAKDLYDAFKKDKQAAGELYSKKIKSVKGFVVYAGPDPYALPSVELSETKGGKSRLMCVLPMSDYLKLRKVSKGDEVIIRGEIRALYEKGDMVLLKQCEIVETPKDTPEKQKL